MKIILDVVDDACIPHVDGERSADAVLMYFKTDPLFFMRAAHSLTIRGYFGQASEEEVARHCELYRIKQPEAQWWHE